MRQYGYYGIPFAFFTVMGRTESLWYLQYLAGICAKAAADAPLENWLDELAVYLSQCLHTDWVFLCLLDEDNGQRKTFFWEHGKRCHRAALSLQQELGDLVLNTGLAVVAGENQLFTVPEIERLRSPREEADIQAAAVPLLQAGHVHGALGVDKVFLSPAPWVEDMQALHQLAACLLNCAHLHSQVQALKAQNTRLLHLHTRHAWPLHLQGPSQSIYEIRQQVEQAASCQMPILLQGEQGTHKNVLSRVLHSWSIRGQGPFVRINCSLPASVLEGELFGYAHTSLPQADVGRKGAFEAADKGTLYLDQINCLPSRLQNRILRAVQEGAVERCGEYISRRVDIRVIASSSTTLAHLLDRGLFRSELFYRINRFSIFLPPLRDRLEDIETLLSSALYSRSREQGSAIRCTPSAVQLLKTYDWPGNIRELEALASRIILTHREDRIRRSQIRELLYPDPAWNFQERDGPREEPPPMPIQELEKKAILSALRRHGGSQKKAAQELSISPRQLGYRISKYNLQEIMDSMRKYARQNQK